MNRLNTTIKTQWLPHCIKMPIYAILKIPLNINRKVQSVRMKKYIFIPLKH